ncbi:MAG: hypothetical protein HYT72_02730 [Candidatus Aenigmarchaeota archaeon]|nr:hypothetical protein [Candidatus Aenigmarchaeota archaeon]
MGKEKSLKDAIIVVLATEHPLTAKKIYNIVKREGFNVSYHAVYKAVKYLIEQGTVSMENKDYRINSRWIENVKRFINTFESVSIAKEGIESNYFKKLLLSGLFTIERGRIKLYGNMEWILNPATAYACMLQEIGEKLGAEELYELGYRAGKRGASEFIKFGNLKPKGGWESIQPILDTLEFIGFGKPKFVVAKLEKDGGHHFLLRIKDNPIIEIAAKKFGAKSVVCNWLMGVYTAHGEAELGVKNGRLRENKCMCKGLPYCEWESKW